MLAGRSSTNSNLISPVLMRPVTPRVSVGGRHR